MAEYRISGVWKDGNGVITHYAVHLINATGPYRAEKYTKAKAIQLVEDRHNTVKTWMWNYNSSFWMDGEEVITVIRDGEKYLRSKADKYTGDNLGHLINYDWIQV
jgi:hypothetical protein